MITQAALGAAVATAAGLAAAGCTPSANSAGGPGHGAGTSPSPTASADPLVGLTAQQIAVKAIDGLKSVPSFTMTGTVPVNGKTATMSYGITGNGCSMTMSMGSQGTMTMLLIGKTMWMKGDAAFYKSSGSGDMGMMKAFVGKYVKLPADEGSKVAPASAECSVSEMMSSSSQVPLSADVVRARRTTLNGQPVYSMTDKAGDATMYVTDTAVPRVVELVSTKKGDTGHFTVTYGVPKSITPPPASETTNFPSIPSLGS